MTFEVTSTPVLAGLGVVLVLLLVWRARARRARRARAVADAAGLGTRLVSLAGRVLVNTALIVTVQWVVIVYQGSSWLALVVLALPAVFAATTLTRAVTVTTLDVPCRRGGGR